MALHNPRSGVTFILAAALACAVPATAAAADSPWLLPSEPTTWGNTAGAKTNSSGSSKSDIKSLCFESTAALSPDEFFAQTSTGVTTCTVLSKPGFHQCWMTYGAFREMQPGVFEPRSACASVYVRSRSGIINAGKSSKVQGIFKAVKGTHRSASPDHSLRLDPVLSRRVAITPGFYRTTFDPDHPVVMTVAIPISSLEAIVRDNFGAQMKEESFGFAKLTRFQFVGHSDRNPTLQLAIGIDSPILRCNPLLTFWIAHSTPADLIVQIGQVIPDCQNRGALSGAFNLAEELSKSLAKSLSDSIMGFIGEESDFKKWARKDPTWADLISSAHLQGVYCTSEGKPALCVTLAWDHSKFIRQYAAKYADRSPQALGPVDNTVVQSELARFREAAKAVMKESTIHAGFSYPAAKDSQGGWRDRDVAIYAGLLCLSGEEVGCDAVAKAQGPNGQWWRSPDLVGSKPKEGDSFSGDQLNGVIAYLATKRDVSAYRNWMAFLRTQKAGVPTPESSLDFGYRTCTDDKGVTCLLGGPDWYWLNAVGSFLEASDQVPMGETDVDRRYGFSPAMIYWQSVTAPAGYRLHLTGIQILLARKFGVEAAELNQAAAVLAGRQPANPFYLYLHLGKDQRVLDAAKSKCDVAATQTRFEDWAWQNAEFDETWKTSMLWDCVFMYRLLS